MKSIVFSFCVITIVGVALGQIVLPGPHRRLMKQAIKKCQENPATRASEEWLKNENLATADKEGANILCRLQILGSIDKNGDIDVEGMRRDLSTGINDPAIVDKIVDKCQYRTPGSTPEQSAVENYKCVLLTYQSLTSGSP